MTRFILLITCALAFNNAYAAEDGKFENCNRIAGLAEQIMDARQKGVPADRMYPLFLKQQDKDKRDYLVGLVTSAYDVPEFSSDENKRKAIADFKNRNLVDCMR